MEAIVPAARVIQLALSVMKEISWDVKIQDQLPVQSPSPLAHPILVRISQLAKPAMSIQTVSFVRLD